MATNISQVVAKAKASRAQAINALLSERSRIDQMLQELGHNGTAPARTKTPTAAGKGKGRGAKKRVRRSPEELAKIADQVYAAVKNAGEEGLSGPEIRKRFPIGDAVQSITEFVKAYSDKRLKTKGAARNTTYHAA
jgi:hypothetical protein